MNVLDKNMKNEILVEIYEEMEQNYKKQIENYKAIVALYDIKIADYEARLAKAIELIGFFQ